MSNQDRYDSIFEQVLEVGKDQLAGLGYKDVPQWDSVGQMKLLNEIEETFGIQMAPLDIMDFDSYESGRDILRDRYHIEF